MVQLGKFLGRHLGPLMKACLPLLKNVLTSLAKSALMLLGLTAAASAIDAGIQKKIKSGMCYSNLENDNDILK